jgi:hypothetical protein
MPSQGCTRRQLINHFGPWLLLIKGFECGWLLALLVALAGSHRINAGSAGKLLLQLHSAWSCGHQAACDFIIAADGHFARWLRCAGYVHATAAMSCLACSRCVQGKHCPRAPSRANMQRAAEQQSTNQVEAVHNVVSLALQVQLNTTSMPCGSQAGPSAKSVILTV